MSVVVKNFEGEFVTFEVGADVTVREFKKLLIPYSSGMSFAVVKGAKWITLNVLMGTLHGEVLTMQRLKTPQAQAKTRLATGKSSSSRAHADLNPVAVTESKADAEASHPKRQCTDWPLYHS